MPIKTFRPTTPTRRFHTVVSREGISKSKPEKSLVESRTRSGGRNSTGRVTSRFIGGGAKKAYRVVDFKRDTAGIPAVVASIEYDPNRSARLALLNYADGEKRYILQPDGLKVGQKVMSGADADILLGNALPLKNVPAGTIVHNIELRPGKGGIRRVQLDCMATVGQVGNVDHENVSLGKAGRTRWLGKTPHNRGVSMNPVDHPHGGGEGKTSGGRHPVTPWGQPTRGFKTRNNKRTNKWIVTRKTKKR
jgi:large subunit ribosomal protein L2